MAERAKPRRRGVSRHVRRPPLRQARSPRRAEAPRASRLQLLESEQVSRHERLLLHHRQTLWAFLAVILLGLWTMAAPFTLGYDNATATLPSGREPWLSLPMRVAAMTWSDVASGALLVVFGWRSLTAGRTSARWAACLVGIWLTVAPLLFWAPAPVAYLNDTLVGALVIAFAILVPGVPNQSLFTRTGGQIPPGWSYNPSSWAQRASVSALGFAGWTVTRYLAAFQLGYIDGVWDPFFDDGTRQALTSDLASAMPVSHVGVASLAYGFIFQMGFLGGSARWRTAPWLVALLGVVVLPLGITHLFLVLATPLVVGAWCSFCLLAALLMLALVPLAADELIATGQHLWDERRRGEPFWRAFWLGGASEGALDDDRTPPMHKLAQHPRRIARAAVFGVSVPMNLVVTAALGLWLLFTPAVFDVGRPGSILDHVTGALIVTLSVLAFGEVLRVVRLFNLPLAIGVAFAPFFVAGGNVWWHVHGVVVGLLVLVLSIPTGPQRETYGRWDRIVW